jgi:hypothetical protein
MARCRVEEIIDPPANIDIRQWAGGQPEAEKLVT